MKNDKDQKQIDSRLRWVQCAADLLLNLWIVAVTAGIVVWFFVTPERGSRLFVYFTVDSNVLCALGSLAVLICRLCPKYRRRVPRPVLLLKMTGTAAVALTFLVVLLFLGPFAGYGRMYDSYNLHMHLVTPLCAVVSFLLLDGEGTYSRREALLGGIPAAVYGIVYFVQVIVRGQANGGWSDFYRFNMFGLWPVSGIAVIGGAFGLSLLLRVLFQRIRKTEG